MNVEEKGNKNSPTNSNRTSNLKNVPDNPPSITKATTPTFDSLNIEKFIEKIQRIKLQYPTNHLKGFTELHKATRLIGDDYKVIIKAVWYNIMSCKISRVSLQLNQIHTDGRIHLLIPLKSGKGKKELKRVIKNLLQSMNKTVEEPTSIHPEQLVGKTIRIKNRKSVDYENIPGFFSRDYIIIDEGKTLLTSNELIYSESRRYLRLALDPYPDNTITKRAVDIPFGHELEYTPHMGCSIFTQPYYFKEDFATDGDLRRFIVPYVNMSGVDRTKAYRHRVEDNSISEDYLKLFKVFLSSLDDYGSFELTEEAEAEFLNASLILINRGFNYSVKVANFVDIYDFTIQDILLKMSAVQALQDDKNIITKKHVCLAFIDLAEFLEHLYHFVHTKIHGMLDYGEAWRGAEGNDQELLNWLYIQGATSQETTTISINDYVNKIQEVCNVKERQAKNIKKRHKKNGWIKSKKEAHGSELWIGFDPVRNARGVMQLPGHEKKIPDFEEYYHKTIKQYVSESITPLSPQIVSDITRSMEISDKDNSKIESNFEILQNCTTPLAPETQLSEMEVLDNKINKVQNEHSESAQEELEPLIPKKEQIKSSELELSDLSDEKLLEYSQLCPGYKSEISEVLRKRNTGQGGIL